jgi:hypothetical protein
MSKRMIESLDEDDNRKEIMIKKKKERKSYSNCFHATHSGMRCLNMSKNGVKIGQECYDFCKEHFDATLLKLFTILIGPIKIEQEQSRGMELITFDPISVEIWNVDDTEIVAEIDHQLHLTVPYAWNHRQQSSMSELISKVMPFLDQQPGFVIKYEGVSRLKIESGGFENKVYGHFKGDLVKFPVDDLVVEEEHFLSFEIPIEFL